MISAAWSSVWRLLPAPEGPTARTATRSVASTRPALTAGARPRVIAVTLHPGTALTRSTVFEVVPRVLFLFRPYITAEYQAELAGIDAYFRAKQVELEGGAATVLSSYTEETATLG